MLLAAIVSLSSPALASAGDADPLLVRMVGAIRNLDYQGAFVYLRAGQPESMQIFHAGGEPERERIIGLGGTRVEYSRVGSDVVCENGTEPATLFERPLARLLPLVPDLRSKEIARYYTVTLGAEDRVAGYAARRIEVVPRDGYRYGYRLWLEQESGFPLRSTIVDASRRTLEEYLFVTLDLGRRPRDADLQARAPASAAGDAREEVVKDSRWSVADLPPGFTRVKVERPPGAAPLNEHQTYSDGVANVSVYIESRVAGEASERGFSRGMINIFTREAGAWRMTALGDVPRATLERMVRSIRPADSAEAGLKGAGPDGTSPASTRQ